MALKAREWTPLDKAAMHILSRQREAANPRPSLRTLGEAIGVTHPRIKALFDCTAGTPTLDEFCALCEYFHLDPAKTLEAALQTTGR